MITSKKEMRKVINEDRKAWGLPPISSNFKWFLEDIKNLLHPGSSMTYIYNLRHEEYHINCPGMGIKKALYRFTRKVLWNRTGIELFPNVADSGLWISHGKIVVSASAKIGKNCKILSDVTIGGQGRYDRPGAPTIGDRVFISSGARIIGPITIANDVVIGANAVVVKDITEPGITVGGIPAKKISDTGSYHFLNR